MSTPAAAVLPARGEPMGRVYLVGGGPGDPDLLTLRARRLLDEADVVVHDRLGPVGVLDELPASTLRIDVGKQPHRHPVPQEEINAVLVEHARAGRTVVRLKGGDPFVLGRGGEEMLACRAAGVPVEVVPGVTSAFAAPLAAGIPVTHRGLATGVLVVSGHDELDPDGLAATLAAGRTVVVLMGMARLHELAAALQRVGVGEDMPAAVVADAWSPRERVVKGCLSTIAAQVASARLGNPAVIVFGAVAEGVDAWQS